MPPVQLATELFFAVAISERASLVGARTLVGAPGLTTRSKDATRNKCIASSNKCLTSSNKKLLGAPGIATSRILTRSDRTQ